MADKFQAIWQIEKFSFAGRLPQITP
jgi:hypothetical protein